ARHAAARQVVLVFADDRGIGCGQWRRVRGVSRTRNEQSYDEECTRAHGCLRRAAVTAYTQINRRSEARAREHVRRTFTVVPSPPSADDDVVEAVAVLVAGAGHRVAGGGKRPAPTHELRRGRGQIDV